MDNSKLNQTELSYESSAGTARVNLVTGRLLYEHFDASVGLNNKNLSVSHIYNSYFESNGSTGNNWKLDIQQYLYYNENDTYTYIDAVGMEHTFEHLNGSEYYDTSGMGLILSVENEETKITDLTGNEMYFEHSKLVKIKSNEGYEKIIKYNKDLLLRNKNIISMYDSRDSGTKIDFEYDENDLLKKINVKNTYLKYSMKYFYDNFELTHITKEVIIDEELDEDGEYKNKVEKIETMFKYNDNNLLIYAVSFLDKNGFNFNYYNNKVSKVITGTGNIVEEISEEVSEEPIVEAVTVAEITFRSQKLLDQHYDKHGIEMGFASAEEYELAAYKVTIHPDTLHKIESEDGDGVFYREETNEFVVVSQDGYIRTYFNPSAGIDYYNRQ